MVSAGSTHVNYCIDVQGVGEIIPYSNAPNKGQEQVQFTPSLNQTTNKLMPFNNSTVVTPVSYKTLNILLEGYPSEKGHWLVEGFKYGFRLGYEGPRVTRLSNNLISASQYPDIVEKKIKKEVSLGRIVDPFSNLPFTNLQVSPIGFFSHKRGRPI